MPIESEEDIGSHGTGVTGGYEPLSMWVLVTKLRSSAKEVVILATDPLSRP